MTFSDDEVNCDVGEIRTLLDETDEVFELKDGRMEVAHA